MKGQCSSENGLTPLSRSSRSRALQWNDERLKNGGTVLTEKYFDRLLERIREIRISKRRFYQKITDIYATAIDYDKDANATREFFASLRSTALCRTGCSCPTLTDTCLSWRTRGNRKYMHEKTMLDLMSGRVVLFVMRLFRSDM
jgi:hypothetical protein